MRTPVAFTAALLGAALVTTLTACAPPAAAPNTEPTAEPAPTEQVGDGHGAVAGAAEVAEPPLHLVTIGDDGTAARIDLVDLAVTEIGRTADPTGVITDGRYVFVETADGVEIVDSGVWSWDHVDHFHFYRADGSIVGVVDGAGAPALGAATSPTSGGTALLFDDTAIVLDNEALSTGEITRRVDTDRGDLTVLATLGGAVVSADASSVGAETADGEPLTDRVACETPAGTIATRVGTVIGCADGAVLATGGVGGVELTHIPLVGDAPAPTTFDNRKGRPTVAGVAAGVGFWLLDTRELGWELVTTSEPLVAVTAVDNADEHVVALDARGRVRVFADGVEIAATDVLASDPTATGVSLTVDERRAYLAVPGEAIVYEIDFADSARIAREIPLPDGTAFVVETGR